MAPNSPFSRSTGVIQGFFPGNRLPFPARPVRPGASGTAVPLPPALAPRLGNGGGQPMPEAIQRKMEAALGASFSDVRVHVGAEASALGALAFTHGSHIYFAPGQYAPHTPHGQRLLGHELAHVLQQRSARVRNPLGAGLAVVHDPGLEAEAERLSLRAAVAPSRETAVQRKPAPVPRPSPVARPPVVAPLAGSGTVQLAKREKKKKETSDVPSLDKTPHTLGIPPSRSISEEGLVKYFRKKSHNQQNKYVDRHVHLTHEEVIDSLNMFEEESDPQSATAMVYVDGNLVDTGLVSPTDFLGNYSHVEQEISKLDREANLLGTALTVFRNDLLQKQGTRDAVHALAIVGPAGACDGCKDKIRKFKQAWRGLAGKKFTGSGHTATLTVSYYYTTGHYTRKRKNDRLGIKKDGLPTMYGWKEEVAVEGGYVRTFGKTVS